MSETFGNKPADDDSTDCPAKTENIIVIGSEFEYKASGFQLKLMFMACGYATAAGILRLPGWSAADRTTIAYVNRDYNRWELLNLNYLRDNLGIRIVPLKTVSDFTNLLRDRGAGTDRHDIKNLAIFSHGLPNYFALNYGDWRNLMAVRFQHFANLPSDLFAPGGQIASYACRTAMNNLAQDLANHFGVVVRAFKRRTNYGNVIRARSAHAALAAQMKAARKGREGERIELPPDHEAYPHPGLSGGRIPLIPDGGEKEGINDYALWRLGGARAFPESGDTPANQPKGMFRLEPETA